MPMTHAEPAHLVPGAMPRRGWLRNRLLPALPRDVVWGWLGPLVITVIAALMRFDRLGIPSTKVFDEVYYAHDSESLIHHGYEVTDQGTAAFIVHPPLGKWMIGIGELIFGDNATGWRFSAAVVGSLAVLVLARAVRRMTRSTLLGCVAGLLLAMDGLEFVQSRISMLDIFLMFWIVVAFACLVADRDHVRLRLARKIEAAQYQVSGPGPRLGMRWWLVGAGLAIGAACAVKWSGLYFVPVFALLALSWNIGARRASGIRRPVTSALRRDLPVIVGALFLLAGLVYIASWTGWFATSGGWDRQWAVGRPASSTLFINWSFVPDAVRGWWHYHWEMWHFHVTLDKPHPYQSSPWGWLLLARPVLYYSAYPVQGELGCTASKCARMIYDLGTPAIWWAAIPVLLVMVWLWISRRDWRAMAVLGGVAAALVPWLATPDRTMFLFYALPALPFIVIGITMTIGVVLGPSNATVTRRRWGAVVAGVYLLLVVVMFFYFLPIYTAHTLPYFDWYNGRAWFPSWV